TGVGDPTNLPNPLDATGAVGDFLNKLGIIFHGGFWLRVAMALGGLVMIALALSAAFKQFGKGLPAEPIPRQAPPIPAIPPNTNPSPGVQSSTHWRSPTQGRGTLNTNCAYCAKRSWS